VVGHRRGERRREGDDAVRLEGVAECEGRLGAERGGDEEDPVAERFVRLGRSFRLVGVVLFVEFDRPVAGQEAVVAEVRAPKQHTLSDGERFAEGRCRAALVVECADVDRAFLEVDSRAGLDLRVIGGLVIRGRSRFTRRRGGIVVASAGGEGERGDQCE